MTHLLTLPTTLTHARPKLVSTPWRVILPQKCCTCWAWLQITRWWCWWTVAACTISSNNYWWPYCVYPVARPIPYESWWKMANISIVHAYVRRYLLTFNQPSSRLISMCYPSPVPTWHWAFSGSNPWARYSRIIIHYVWSSSMMTTWSNSSGQWINPGHVDLVPVSPIVSNTGNWPLLPHHSGAWWHGFPQHLETSSRNPNTPH